MRLLPLAALRRDREHICLYGLYIATSVHKYIYLEIADMPSSNWETAIADDEKIAIAEVQYFRLRSEPGIVIADNGKFDPATSLTTTLLHYIVLNVSREWHKNL
jgi:hypothetical protein